MLIPRRAWVGLGCAMVVVGSVWALQGAGVLPGSVMSGDPKWLVIGAVMAACGGVVAILAARAGRN